MAKHVHVGIFYIGPDVLGQSAVDPAVMVRANVELVAERARERGYGGPVSIDIIACAGVNCGCPGANYRHYRVTVKREPVLSWL